MIRNARERRIVLRFLSTIDDELVVFGASRQAFADIGAVAACSPEETAALCNDKYATCHHLIAKGVPAAQSWLPSELPADLTLPLLRDIGWFPDADLDLVDDAVDECPGSDLRATVFVGRENTGVANAFFANGCTIADLIANIRAGAKNHGGFVSGVAHLLNSLEKAGIISGKDKGIIQSAAARSKA